MTHRPATRRLRRNNTHRLVPSRYRLGVESALHLLAEAKKERAELGELAALTNDLPLASLGRLPGLSAEELVTGVPAARVINAAFCYAHPSGSRFNGPGRGAWYASYELATSMAEVVFHRTLQLSEIGEYHDTVDYDDLLADFHGSFHDIRGDARFAGCLSPVSYIESQRLGEALLLSGSPGIVYPSVRRPGGTCLACFRPAMVRNVRIGGTHRFTWEGGAEPRVEEVAAPSSPQAKIRL